MIDPQRVDDARRALGARLAGWRNARGLTQLALAGRVPVSRTTIAGVETGRQCPDRVFWQRCELALGAGGELLAGYDGYRRLKQQLDQERADAAQRARWGEVEDRVPPAGVRGVPAVEAGRLPGDVGAVGEPGGPSGLTTAAQLADVVVAGGKDVGDEDVVNLAAMSDGRVVSLRVSRRALLELAAGVMTLPAVTAMDVPRSSAVDPAVVDYFAQLRAFLVRADDRLGGLTVLSTVEQQIALIAALRRQARGELRDRLVSTQARWSEFAGWLADDLGDRVAGERWLDRAGSLAQEADDQEFWAYVLARKAQRMVRTSDEDRVAALARAAFRLSDTPALVRAFAAVQQAHGSVVQGDVGAFQAAIERAHSLVADASPTSGDDSLGSFCTRPYLAAQEGEGWLRLQQPDKAIGSFTAAVNEWPERYRRERGVYLSRTAHAYLAASEPGHAATVAAEALTVATTTGSARIRRDVAALARQLEPFRSQRDVRHLLDQLATAG
ncbi:helix-turn-helix transcriptional regulator [Micromonospora rubida]|uniref:helix-turn-helix transcriptional regulator n=1 Tax=Micromonospora rubida TaxID=2697657 RepID=UPI002E282C48|nr:helix-turn-helix transcriptional regulator [Micromonospora rubida]